MKEHKFPTYNNGQSLVEAMIALAALMMVLSAITIATIAGLSNVIFLRNQDLANKYAQDAIEYIRNIKENNTTITVDTFSKQFTSLVNNYCMNSTNTLTAIGAGLTSCSTVNINNTFIRNISISPDNNTYCPNPGPLKGTLVTVTVKWTSNKCPAASQFCHQVNLTTCFSNRSPNI